MNKDLYISLPNDELALLAIYTLFEVEEKNTKKLKEALCKVTGNDNIDLNKLTHQLSSRRLIELNGYDWHTGNYDYSVAKEHMIPLMTFLYDDCKELTQKVLSAVGSKLRPTDEQKLFWEYIISDFKRLDRRLMDSIDHFSVEMLMPIVADERFATLLLEIDESEFFGVYGTTAVKDRKNASDFFEVGERKNDGYLYMVLDVDDQDTLIDVKIIVSTEHSADVNNYGFCVMDDGKFAGKEITIGYANTLGLKAGEKAFYRFADDGYHSYKRTYKSALAADDFKFYRMDSAGSMVEITVDNTFRMLEPSKDGYYYVVICPAAAVPSGEFTIVQEELSVFTVAYYAKFMPEDKIITLTNGLNDYFHINATDVDRIIFKTLGDAKTDVAGLAGLITDFNNEHSGHEIDVILGCRADKNSKLSDAGYQAFDTTDYTYGDPDETARRLWCQKGQTEDAHVLAVRSYLQENWKVSE